MRRFLCTWVVITLVWVSGCAGDSNGSPSKSRGGPSGEVSMENAYGETVAEAGGEVHIHLEFSRTDITDDDLAKLHFPDTVRSISLHHTSITDRGVAELKRAKNLERVNLASTKITEVAVEHLKEIPNLWQAEITSPGINQTASLELMRFLQPRVRERVLKNAGAP